MRIYIAGPMTGYPDWNFPTFRAAAAALRARGHEVISPAELDEADSAPLGSLPWAEYLRRDIPHLISCEAIALLPGWENSRGARLEHHIATALGMSVHLVDDLLGG